MPAPSSPNMGPPFAQSGARSLGWMFVILGAVCVIWPSIATLAFEQLIAVLFVVFGITGLLFWCGFRSGVVGPIGLGTALLALVLGVVLLVQPTAGARTLTLMMGGLFLVEGAIGIVAALALRRRFSGWLWGLASGAATLILGALIFAGWPAGSSWMIGWLFGMHLLTTGIALLTINRTGPVT